VGNAFGKLAGSTQVEELGEIETPILLTSTLSVPRVVNSLISYMSVLSRRWFCQGSPASLP
jgi:D-aminopeptidase